jgi:hypothetical protein
VSVCLFRSLASLSFPSSELCGLCNEFRSRRVAKTPRPSHAPRDDTCRVDVSTCIGSVAQTSPWKLWVIVLFRQECVVECNATIAPGRWLPHHLGMHRVRLWSVISARSQLYAHACVCCSIFEPGFFDSATDMHGLVDMLCVCQFSVFTDEVYPKLGGDVRWVGASLSPLPPCLSLTRLRSSCVWVFGMLTRFEGVHT